MAYKLGMTERELRKRMTQAELIQWVYGFIPAYRKQMGDGLGFGGY